MDPTSHPYRIRFYTVAGKQPLPHINRIQGSLFSCHAVWELGKKDWNQRPGALSGIQVLREAQDRKEEDPEGQMPIWWCIEASMVIQQKNLSLILCLRIKKSGGTTVKPSWFGSTQDVLAAPQVHSWGLVCHGLHISALPFCTIIHLGPTLTANSLPSNCWKVHK